MWTWKPWILLFVLCVQVMLQSTEADINMANHKLSGIIQWKYEKRPFCNAFTGCGKKRATSSSSPLALSPLPYAYPPYPPYPLAKRAELEENSYQNDEMSDAGLGDLIDINAEPAVENVQKQIMSQAKIFEAIKEASKEIFLQKNKQKLRNQQQQQQQLNQQQLNQQQQQRQQQQQQRQTLEDNDNV